MTFNSLAFALFLTVLFIVYWSLNKRALREQNVLLLAASYFFYGWWSWKFLLMLIGISLFNFFMGLWMKSGGDKGRRGALWLGLIVNIGVLGLFKYFNFFVDSFADLISLTGYDVPKTSLRIILPLGISFYIFLSLSYVIDVYKRNLEAETNIISALLTLSFFPIILAGPIQRPATLLPQINSKRLFSYELASDGLRQILWGLFVKVVIADNLAFYADDIFGHYDTYSGSTLLVGALFYSIQIYADFSGYSNIAIGTGKLLGFRLMRNFAYPYFARDIAEFWRRWHISLTTWFRDYIFLPLSFSVAGRTKGDKTFFIDNDLFIYIVASSVTWLLTGLWHGANYTFIIWGLIHGFFLILFQWQKKPRRRLFSKLGLKNSNKAIVLVETFITLFIVMIAWIFFRADNLQQAVAYISGIFSSSLLSVPEFPYMKIGLVVFIFTVIFVFIEWLGREYEYPLSGIESRLNLLPRWLIYYTIGTVIFFFAGAGQKFIYFQF